MPEQGRATEKDWPKRPSDCQLQDSEEDSDRAITPTVEAVRVPAHLVLLGSQQAKQLRRLHAQLSLGQSCHRQKSLESMHTGSLRSFLTLCNPVDWPTWRRKWQPTPVFLPGVTAAADWPTRFLCWGVGGGGGSPGKNTGAYWPILAAIPF